jgi:hypothetical protein
MRRFRKKGPPVEPIPQVQYIDPSEILFSLATISAELPATGAEAARPGDLILHEDDWRQLELVASVHSTVITAQFAAVREIHAERTGVGFARIHVREEPRAPLLGWEVGRDDVAQALGPDHREVSGVAFMAERQRVIGGFAYAGRESAVYGVEEDGVVTTLGLHMTAGTDVIDTGFAALRQLGELHGGLVVDWLACRSYPDVAG